MRSNDEERFVSWLTKQRNANGKLYLPNVARQYANALRCIPLKLDLPVSYYEDKYKVFSYSAVEEFNRLRKIFWLLLTFKRLIAIPSTGRFRLDCLLTVGICNTLKNQKEKL